MARLALLVLVLAAAVELLESQRIPTLIQRIRVVLTGAAALYAAVVFIVWGSVASTPTLAGVVAIAQFITRRLQRGPNLEA